MKKNSSESKWTTSSLGALGAKRSQSINPSKTPEVQFELYSVPSFPSAHPEIVTGKEIGSNKQIVEPKSVLLCKINPRINRVWVVGDFTDHNKIASTEWIVFPFSETVEPQFLCYFLQQNEVREFLAFNASGVGGSLMRVKPSTIRDFPFVYPELDEQRRIVAEIEKQFTRLDAGVAALKRVQANLKRYRAAVLKAACEGRLVPTEAELARAEGRDYENAKVLLQRILTERREKWNGRGKYKEPAAPDVTDLAELPEGWVWTTLDTIADVKGGITKDAKRKHASKTRLIPYLRVANVQRGYLDLSEIKGIEATEEIINQLILKDGDILFNEGGDRDKLGRGWIWNEELPECIHQNHVFRARLFEQDVQCKLISWYGNTFGQKYFFDGGKHTTNLASISLTKLKCLPIPLPPAAEQKRIEEEVERLLSIVEGLEATVIANLQRAVRLRQAILQKAFSGVV